MKLGHRAMSMWATPLPASQGWRPTRLASRSFGKPEPAFWLFSSAWGQRDSMSLPWGQGAIGSQTFLPRSRP
jgi:hypothetical protein